MFDYNFDIIIKGKIYTNVVCIRGLDFYHGEDDEMVEGGLDFLRFIYIDEYNKAKEVYLDDEDILKETRFIRKEKIK